VKDYNDDKANLSETTTILDLWLPVKDPAITRGTLTGEVAVLAIEGTMASGVKALSLVRMIKGPSGWLFDQAWMVGWLD